ncbi:hypothetical protein QCE62_30280 [Caballeronia sp. LZ033]|uniref:cupin domain-containing protein n=1 Tax=Caballeronia sp. LZ033 TaxID=3038566 RepID=UPI00286792A0|nr:hypothetical protein [Caballeronia sp. LZ033]MDR5817907.1 hypothetical protein [Caballeronia sp. LZ033]
MTHAEHFTSHALSKVQVIRRCDIPAITSIQVDDEIHSLGEHRDFRRHPFFRDFIPDQGRSSFSWVSLKDGEILDNHVHPVQSMILICSGSVYLTGETGQLLNEGDAACVPAGKLHGFRTCKGQQFHGLSIQFDGNGLYEVESLPRVAFSNDATHSFASLEKINALLLERHGRNPLFQLLRGNRLRSDAARRKRFLEALLVWSRYFQRMIHARQAFCTEPGLLPLYTRHLRDELGHDTMLQEQHGLEGNTRDPLLERAAQWFVDRMLHADEAEKLVIVHQVVEASGFLFGQASRPLFSPQRMRDACYFDLHAEADGDHRDVGRAWLQNLPAERFAGLIGTCRQAWDQMDEVHARIAALTEAFGSTGLAA